MLYLTRRQKRRIFFSALAIILLLAISTSAYFFLSENGNIQETNQQEQKTEQKEQTDQPKIQEEVQQQFSSYTRYDKKTNTCVYYYEEGKCYVPLSYCVLDEEIKTNQDINKEKFCSDTPEIKVEALISPKGSTCPFTATEGDKISIKSIVKDPDAEDPQHAYGPLGKLEVHFSEPFGDNNGIWQTQKGNAGVHYFKVTVNDGEYTTEKTYCIEIKPGNRPPVLENMQDITVIAGHNIAVEAKCTDPDGDKVTISYTGDLSSREWLLDGKRTTTSMDVGTRSITAVCMDSRGLPTYKSFKVKVLAQNDKEVTNALVFTVEPEDMTVNEGEKVVLNAQAISSTEKPVTIAYSGWMNAATRETGYNDAGTYSVTITATDGISTIEKTIKITVANVNRPPEIVDTTQD